MECTAKPEGTMPVFVCPICEKNVKVQNTADAPFRPFCSRRCKLVDLGRWLDGTYTIPGEPIKDPDQPDSAEHPDADRSPPDS